MARDACGPTVRAPNLIACFDVDGPTWVHTGPAWVHTTPHNEWRGPLFDPAKLAAEAVRCELHRLATRYCAAAHDAMRRRHLILGDRYETRAPLPEEEVRPAPYVDVLSLQDFGAPLRSLHPQPRPAPGTAGGARAAGHCYDWHHPHCEAPN